MIGDKTIIASKPYVDTADILLQDNITTLDARVTLESNNYALVTGSNTKTFKVSNATDKDMAIAFGQFTGYVLPFATDIVPDGFIECNGSELDRTLYADLYSILGDTYGAGDGTTTFKIPDLRGEFIRGWDNSRGADSGRAIGSYQGDAIRNITGAIGITGGKSYGGVSSASGAFSGTNYQAGYLSPKDTAYSMYRGVNFYASRTVPTAADNRPRNIAMMYCIKY